MARIRTIKPDFYSSGKQLRLSIEAAFLLPALWTHSDDEGRLVDDPLEIGARCPRLMGTIEKLLDELQSANWIIRYAVDGKKYIQVHDWHDHQKINRPQPSIIPQLSDNSLIIHGTFTERSLNDHGTFTDHSLGKGKERKGKERKGKEGNGREWTKTALPNASVPDASPAFEIFETYCLSWGRDPSKYKLTPQRKQFILNALRVYDPETLRAAIKRFREDPFPERARFNDLKYLFGTQDRIDRWCSKESTPRSVKDIILEACKPSEQLPLA